MRWLDPASQARLKGLALAPRRAAAGGAPGRHRAPAGGNSRDFVSHRPYAPGDEARAVDWKAYARLDRFFVRQYSAEDRIPLYALVDRSASMGWSADGRESKLDLARRAAAGAAWLAASQGDEAGLVAFGRDALEAAPARAGAGHLAAIDAALDALAPAGTTDYPAALARCAQVLPRRGLFLLIGDLLGPPASLVQAAAAFAATRRELLVLRVFDPAERDFPYEGPCAFEGLEGGELYAEAGEAAAAYRAAWARRASFFAAALRRAGAAYAEAETGAPWEPALARLLAR